MTLPLGVRGRLVALALLLIPAILMIRFIVWPIAGSFISAADDLEITREEIARYQRLLNQMPAMQEAVSRYESQRPLAPYLLAGSNRALAAAEMQGHLQDAAKKHGVTILSLRVQKADSDRGPLERVAVEARVRSSIPELRDLLHFIETTTPYLFVENLSINVRQSRRRNATRTSALDVRITLYGLRAPAAPGRLGVANG